MTSDWPRWPGDLDELVPAGRALAGPDVDAAEVAEVVRSAVAAAFVAANNERLRDPHHLGMSDLGGCTRAAAYALAGVPVSDQPPPDEARAANLGTWQHQGLLPRLRDQLGGVVEEPVVLRAAGLSIPGTLDHYFEPVVQDLKTVGEHRLQTVRRVGGPYQAHRVQVMSYALAAMQAGRTVRFVVWLYLDRASGDVEVIVEEFTNAAALAVIDRVRTIRFFADGDPDSAPREERGPGLSRACDGCWWLRRCWGPDAVRGRVGAQASMVRDDADVVRALALYVDALARGAKADKDKEFVLAQLTRTRYGQYGSYRYSRDRDSSHTDNEQVAADYEAGIPAGSAIPKKPKTGAVRVRLVKTPDEKPKTRKGKNPR